MRSPQSHAPATTPVTDKLNTLLGAYSGAAAQHQTHAALLNACGLAGLGQSMQLHTDDEPITIQSLTDRLL